MKEIAQAQVLGDKVILQSNHKDAMVQMAQEYVDSIYPIFHELNNF